MELKMMEVRGTRGEQKGGRGSGRGGGAGNLCAEEAGEEGIGKGNIVGKCSPQKTPMCWTDSHDCICPATQEEERERRRMEDLMKQDEEKGRKRAEGGWVGRQRQPTY
jgi:hypothetical protein